MTLGVVILVAAMQWYHVLKMSHLSEKNKKEILDIGRTLFQFIRYDLQSSGYRGYRTQDQNFPIRRNFEKQGIPYKFLKTDRAVFGFEAAAGICQQHIPQKFCDNIRKNSDVLVIYNIPQKVNLVSSPKLMAIVNYVAIYLSSKFKILFLGCFISFSKKFKSGLLLI